MKYFAYGTLLTLEAMRQVAPNAVVDGYMRLDGYVMGFGVCSNPDHAGCTLIEQADGVTYGTQFDLADDEMAALDAAAHVPDRQWVHEPITVIDEGGRAVETRTYVIPGEHRPWRPSDEYVQPIRRGIDQCPFPDSYKTFALKLIDDARSPANG